MAEGLRERILKHTCPAPMGHSNPPMPLRRPLTPWTALSDGARRQTREGIRAA